MIYFIGMLFFRTVSKLNSVYYCQFIRISPYPVCFLRSYSLLFSRLFAISFSSVLFYMLDVGGVLNFISCYLFKIKIIYQSDRGEKFFVCSPHSFLLRLVGFARSAVSILKLSGLSFLKLLRVKWNIPWLSSVLVQRICMGTMR